MPGCRRPLLLGLLCLVAALLVPACGAQAPRGAQADAAYPAPSLQGADLQGRHQDLAQLRGSVVIVTAWASWCGPCRDEVPVLTRAQERLGPAGLEVLGINVQDHPEAARAFVEQEQSPFASVVDADGTISVDWGLRGLPESFLVDRDGQVVAHRFGAVDEQWVNDVVARVVQP